MNKKGIVGSVQSNGTWEGKYGMMYKYEVTIGEDVGEYSSKSENQNKFVVGQEAEYEFIGGQYPKIKPVSTFQPNSSGGGGFNGGNDSNRQMMIVKQSSLNRAVDMVIGDKLDMKDVLTTAQKFTDWVMSNEKKQETSTPATKPQPAKQVEAFATSSNDVDGDLPF